MRTLVITLSCLALAVVLTSFAPSPWTSAPVSSGASISTTELTLAAGALATPEYADAH
jgi:hypothetical protein